MRRAVRAAPLRRRRKSAKAATGDVLAKVLATCASGSLHGLRDQALAIPIGRICLWRPPAQ